MSDRERRPKLLVVEDDKVNNKFVGGLLSGLFTIRFEDSAANAAKTLKDGIFKPDFILSDYMVPTVEEFNMLLEVLMEVNFPLSSLYITSSYYEAIREINTYLRENNIPQQLLEDDFLKKPTDITGLLRKFKRLADSWQTGSTSHG